MIYPWLNLIVAMTEYDRGIGLYNSLPWPRITEDMLRFNKLTKNSIVIMGAGTFRSLDFRPLPDRHNIVLTSDRSAISTLPQFFCFDNLAFMDLGTILLMINRMQERKEPRGIWIIGGAKVYQEFIGYVDKMYITLVKQKFYCDRFFPEIDKAVWQLDTTEPGENKEILIEFQVWSRK